MLFDAIVVAGGRSSRLGGSSKAALVFEGETLLARAIDAASGARYVIVVGPVTPSADGSDADVVAIALDEPDLDGRIVTTREDPPFGGPVAALAAGIEALADLNAEPADQLLLLACDMPNVADAVTVLLDAADAASGRQVAGFIAVDEQRHPQPLVAIYDPHRLSQALEENGPDVAGLSMRALLRHLDLIAVEVPSGSTNDVDTWADAAEFGIEVSTKGHR